MIKRIVQLAVYVAAYGIAGTNLFLFSSGIRLSIPVFQMIRLASGTALIVVTSILYFTQRER